MDTKSIVFIAVIVGFFLLVVFRGQIQKLLHWLPPQFWEWLDYLKKNTQRAFSSLWESFESISVLLLLCSAILSALFLYYSHGKPFSLEAWGALEVVCAMLGLIILGAVFLVFFLAFTAVFILSLHPKGRKIADKYLLFRPTKLKALEKRTEIIEDRLTSLEKRVGKVEDALTKIGDAITSVDTRLGNIENGLDTIEKKLDTHIYDKDAHNPKRKPKEGKKRG